ncbi:hypothetical protein ACFWYW_04120 [Nonomuraea sp. NPDC059023]|uniref:hypothetical protein n=1 Tax=unclassified Nonomuraea TaxID=2593643 RepID=UPI0036B870A2
MPAPNRENLAAMLDVLVYENVLIAWRRLSFGRYEIVSRDGEEIILSTAHAEMWAVGAFAVYLALVDQGRISPRMP